MINLIGKKFGRLVVIQRENNDKWGHPKWLCLCECKNKKIILGSSLKNSKTKSCGCLYRKGNNLKHGHNTGKRKSKTYRSWSCMIQRCINPKNKDYKYYGKIGITVCDRWLNSFPNFLEDMGEAPTGLTLERENNKKGYHKENCRWATRKEQQRNRRNNRLITAFGRTQLLIEWSEETGIPYMILWDRIYRYYWSIEKALTISVRKQRTKGEKK